VLPSGSAYLVNNHLTPLPADQTYQLWGVVGGRAVSLGPLGNQPTTVPFTIDTSATVTAYAVTAERAGGVVVTTHAPVARSSTLTT
jgi:anti-sigma-K factor RskA